MSHHLQIPQVQDFPLAACLRLDSDGELKPIRAEEPDNCWSPLVTAFISLIMEGGGATSAHMCAIRSIVFVSWTVERN